MQTRIGSQDGADKRPRPTADVQHPAHTRPIIGSHNRVAVADGQKCLQAVEERALFGMAVEVLPVRDAECELYTGLTGLQDARQLQEHAADAEYPQCVARRRLPKRPRRDLAEHAARRQHAEHPVQRLGIHVRCAGKLIDRARAFGQKIRDP